MANDDALPEDADAAASPPPWPLVESRPGPDLVLFQARIDTLRNPRTGAELPRLILETHDWVNVVAVTPEDEVVLVRQFRFGSGTVTTELPAGMVEPGEASEAAARRELREETGFTARTWTHLGTVEPNPSYHDNLCHHWLAEDATCTEPVDLDAGEDIAVTVWPWSRVRAALDSGEMRHSLVISALCRVLDLRGDRRFPGES